MGEGRADSRKTPRFVARKKLMNNWNLTEMEKIKTGTSLGDTGAGGTCLEST